MKAVIMAGGEGSRLRPLTLGRPKPMIPLVNKPVLSHILDLLRRSGITDVVITLQYLEDRIRDYYGDGSNLGMNIDYSVETVPLGTAGSVRQAAALLDETFLVISGDALTDFDLRAVVESHRANGALATMTLARVGNPLEYGVVQSDDAGRILHLYEKPGWAEVRSDTVNTGIYVLEPELLERIEAGVVCDFSHDLFEGMIADGAPLFGHVAEGYWTDIGQLEEYRQATADALESKVELESLGAYQGGGIWVGGEVEIAPDAQLVGPLYLGPGVKLKAGVVVHGPAVIRDNVVVDNHAQIERSIIWRNSYVGERVELRGTIIGLQSSIKAGALLHEGVVVSDNTVVRENAVIQPNVKIWPDKEIEAGATVTSSIIWGSQGKRTLFGRYGVTGMVNVDLTPEFCAKIGAAFGATLPKGAVVVVNREPHNTPRVLKRAILSGLPSAGVHVRDSATQPIPVVRFYVREVDASSGIHARLSPYDNRVVDIKFFDSEGMDLSQREQRSIETIFFREDFRRVYLDEIGQINYATDVTERYGTRFIGALERDLWPIEGDYDHVVVDYANASTAMVLPDLLNQLRCDVVSVNTLVEQSRIFRTRPQWEAAMRQLGAITQALNANFGVRLDVGGERVFFTASSGAPMTDMEAASAVTRLVFQSQPGAVVGVPLTAPRLFERLAERYGGRIERLRVELTPLMQAAANQSFAMVCDTRGAFIFPDFSPFPDGMFAIVKLIELTRRVGQTLSEIWIDREPFYLAHGRVPCEWSEKGRVMRLLDERFREASSPQGEGIFLALGEEWVLILADSEEPFFLIHAEGVDQESAAALVAQHTAIVTEIVNGEAT